MYRIIQFPHPGGEHNSKSKVMGWNTGTHKRKFLISKGTYILEDELKKSELIFWGEWEPPSRVEKLNTQDNQDNPKFLHHPFLSQQDFGANLKKGYQNTDPFVFENEFKYFICKQVKNNKSTTLARLDKGSLILFGSTKGNKSQDAFFQLDTVFVVGDYVEYIPEQQIQDKRISDYYKKLTLERCFNYSAKCTPKASEQTNLKFRIYIGATFENPYEGMYSYVPAKIFNGEKTGFPRIKLQNLDFITNNLNASPKITSFDQIEPIKKAWDIIRRATQEQGCIEAVCFDQPSID